MEIGEAWPNGSLYVFPAVAGASPGLHLPLTHASCMSVLKSPAAKLGYPKTTNEVFVSLCRLQTGEAYMGVTYLGESLHTKSNSDTVGRLG